MVRTRVRVSPVPLQRVDGIEQTAERVVDLVRHAGGEPPEAGEALLLGELGIKRLALGHGGRQFVEGCEWPLVVGAGGGDDRLGYGIDLAVVTALEVAGQRLHGPHHARRQ